MVSVSFKYRVYRFITILVTGLRFRLHITGGDVASPLVYHLIVCCAVEPAFWQEGYDL